MGYALPCRKKGRAVRDFASIPKFQTKTTFSGKLVEKEPGEGNTGIPVGQIKQSSIKWQHQRGRQISQKHSKQRDSKIRKVKIKTRR